MNKPWPTVLLLSATIVLPALFVAYLKYNRDSFTPNPLLMVKPIEVSEAVRLAGFAPNLSGSDAQTQSDRHSGRVGGKVPLNPLVMGVVYSTGGVEVNWNGVKIPVQKGTYAYSGGEVIRTRADASAILQLGNAGTIFLCPDSEIQVSQKDGKVQLDVIKGFSRFVFDKDTPFQVRANDVLLEPLADDQAQENAGDARYVGEIQAVEDGGCLVCDLKKNLGVSLRDGAGNLLDPREGQLDSGQILRISRDQDGNQVQANEGQRDWKASHIAIPDNIFNTLSVGDSQNALAGVEELGYLCRCHEIEEYARALAQPATAAGPEVADPKRPQLAMVDSDSLSMASVLPKEPDINPPVSLPSIPEAEPDFNPDTLEPTGAGDEPEPTVVTIPPPLVPGGGSGGGPVVSPS